MSQGKMFSPELPKGKVKTALFPVPYVGSQGVSLISKDIARTSKVSRARYGLFFKSHSAPGFGVPQTTINHPSLRCL